MPCLERNCVLTDLLQLRLDISQQHLPFWFMIEVVSRCETLVIIGLGTTVSETLTIIVRSIVKLIQLGNAF